MAQAPKPKFKDSNTHYWCDVCAKFVKNTSIDRKSHENGRPHQEAKERKIAELRSTNVQAKLMEDLARIEEKANKSMARDHSAASSYNNEFSTFQATSHASSSATLFAKAPTATDKAANKSDPLVAGSSASAASAASAAPVKVEEAPKSTEAALPGRWEVVEEEEQESKFRKTVDDDFDVTAEASKANPKKRERYDEDEDALEQMESEARVMSATARGERVPEQYRADGVASTSDSSEPVFKAKAAKGANTKKRVKQL